MEEDIPFSAGFSQDNWPEDIPYWLFNGRVKVPIGCEICGQPLKYRPGQRNADNWQERYYCPHCGWPDEVSLQIIPIPSAFLAYDEESESGS